MTICEACGNEARHLYSLGCALTLEAFLKYTGASEDIAALIHKRRAENSCGACGASSCPCPGVGTETALIGDQHTYLCAVCWGRACDAVNAEVLQRREQLALREQVVQKAAEDKQRLDAIHHTPSLAEFTVFVEAKLGSELPPGYRVVCDEIRTPHQYGLFVLDERGREVHSHIRMAFRNVLDFDPTFVATIINAVYVARCREPKRKWVR